MHFVQAKGILSPYNGMNLYRGCLHGCIYCDSRSSCYQMDHPFEDVEVKENALALLEGELRKKRRPCMIATGSMSDPYLPLEEQLQLTRGALELALRFGFGFTLITKSARVLRDLDLLQAINERTKCVVQMTLTTYDEALCRKLEPNVSTTRERVEALMRLREAGIPTVVWLCPILPFLNDTEENIRGVLTYCAEAGVRGVVCFGMGLTLREGSRVHPPLRRALRAGQPAGPRADAPAPPLLRRTRHDARQRRDLCLSLALRAKGRRAAAEPF